MKKTMIALCAVVFIWGSGAGFGVQAGGSAGVNMAAPETLGYVHLYTDPGGMTHFRDEKFKFHTKTGRDPHAGFTYHDIAGAQGASLVKLKKGVVEDWHNAPRTQFAVVIQGEVEITAGDGEVRRLKPGEIALLDDTSGKGHKTAATGNQDHIALMIPVKPVAEQTGAASSGPDRGDK